MPNDTYKPIACSDYDMLEIACTDRYRVRLTTSAGVHEGIASDLKVANHEEFLVLRVDTDQEQAIRVDRILSLTVLSEPRRFSEHRFDQAGRLRVVPGD